jgi:hypothetical protein
MTRDEIVKIATGWVRERYPIVPPVAAVSHFTDEGAQTFHTPPGRGPFTFGLSYDDHPELPRPTELIGKWVVSFFCSWDTDEAGMPETLHVYVDDSTGEVELA